jgi:hypothetical protein
VASLTCLQAAQIEVGVDVGCRAVYFADIGCVFAGVCPALCVSDLRRETVPIAKMLGVVRVCFE